mgnify:CR=1 FL=1
MSPVHNNEYFANYAKTLEEMGADSICIKDMAGLLKPYTCYELVSELKKTVKIPVDIHSHYTAGLASMSILKGIEAGADIVDTAMSLWLWALLTCPPKAWSPPCRAPTTTQVWI